MSQNDDAENANIAFTLVARNERARQMWADPHNSSRWALFSHDWQGPTRSREKPEVPENYDQQVEVKKKTESEPALQFSFEEKPKDYTKGFLLGSDSQTCDVLLGSSDTGINHQMLAFTFNIRHELIMNDTSIQTTTVKFNDQLPAKQNRFSWILPSGQDLIRVTVGEDVGHDLVFDVVLPEYDPGSIDEYHKNCKPFVIPGAGERLITESFSVGSTAATGQGSGASKPASPFYLRSKELGKGTFGRVYKALRMPDGRLFAAKVPIEPNSSDEDFAAKKLKSEKAFKKEVDVLKVVCKTPHDNIVQFVDEWYGDHTGSIVLDYISGGNLQKQLAQMQDAQVQMEPGEIINISHQLMKALEFIHDKGIVHQDVKPGNILRKSRDQYMLADFGCAGRMGPVMGGHGTTRYMAPESDKTKPYRFEADMWSLGVVILNCLDGLPTGDGKPRPEWCEGLRQKIIDYDSLFRRHSDKKPEIQKQAIQLIHVLRRYMLQLNPADRMSAKKILENFPSLWEQGAPTASSRIEESGEQGTPGASSKIEEGGEFEVMTPPSVGRLFFPALEFEQVQVHLPTAPNVDQGTHSDPPANNAPANEAPVVDDPTKITPNGSSKPEGEANAPFLPGFGEKRKRGDRSSATDDGEKEAIAPGRRPTANPDSPANIAPPLGPGNLLPPKDLKRLRSKQSAAGKPPSEGH